MMPLVYSQHMKITKDDLTDVLLIKYNVFSQNWIVNSGASFHAVLQA